MRAAVAALILGGVLLASGCSTSRGGSSYPVPGGPDVVIVGGERDGGGGTVARGGGAGRGGGSARGARSIRVPPGHYPPPGACRLWYVGRPPGHQPPATSCRNLVGRVPHGAFVLYNNTAWDTQYDWRDHERRNRGTVPDVILDLMRSVSR